MARQKNTKPKAEPGRGKLRIGDNWNAITIIALSQNNPLKAVAEFVENSIDAGAKNIHLLRGKQKGEYYLKIVDDGQGIDDFTYVATHIADSIKRTLKQKGIAGIQGEFGIGLLSFWTVGEELTITSTGAEGITRRMKLVKNNPGYSVQPVNAMFPSRGTELLIRPLLPGIRQLTGEKIQNYLASELRDRISRSGALIRVIDRTARKELVVKPRQFTGRLIHDLPEPVSPMGEMYCELYITEPGPENAVGLYKAGTRVLPSITAIDYFNAYPWTSGYLEGIVDASFIQLTPGTRDGIVYDGAFESFCASMEAVSSRLTGMVDEQRRADEEKTSAGILHSVKKALREAFLLLPPEEYGWLDIYTEGRRGPGKSAGERAQAPPVPERDGDGSGTAPVDPVTGLAETKESETGQDGGRAFFEYPGPLYGAVVSPAAAIVGVNEKRQLRVIARDKSRRQIDAGISISWSIVEGEGAIDNPRAEIVQFAAPPEPGITRVEAAVTQEETVVRAECVVTVTDQLVEKRKNEIGAESKKGLPGYTYVNAPGELWRSRYDRERNIIIINKGNANFLYASKNPKRKLKYITRLFSKELVLANFPEASREELLERMIELNLYTEEHLR